MVLDPHPAAVGRPLVERDEVLTVLPGTLPPDRVEAIHYAMDNARPGDVIILAGKGHEDYQEINHVHYPMDERVIVAEHLKEMQK